MNPTMPFVVQMANSLQFDFGGETLARFKHGGCAYAYAKQVHESLNREVRVIRMRSKGFKVEFSFDVKESVGAA